MPPARRVGPLGPERGGRLVRLNVNDDRRKPVGEIHHPADLLHQQPGRLVVPQVQIARELRGRHPVQMRGHDVEGPVPVPQRRVRAVHERPGRRRLLRPTVAALVDAARSCSCNTEDEAVRPASPEQILRVRPMAREQLLKLVSGQWISVCEVIRHASLRAQTGRERQAPPHTKCRGYAPKK